VDSDSIPEEVWFFACIGRLAVAWAHLEVGLEMMVSITRNLGGSEIEPERPKALNRKLKYLRKYFNSIKSPDIGIQNYARLFDEIAAKSDFRHDIIHGALVERAAGEGNTKLVRILHVENRLDPKPIQVDSHAILQAAKEAEALASKTLKWGDEMSDRLRELARQAGVQIP
jgi:hypothetical protein